MIKVAESLTSLESLIATAPDRIIDVAVDGCEEGIIGSDNGALGLFYHTAFTFDGDDAVEPKVVVENLFDDDAIIGEHVNDLTEAATGIGLTDGVAEAAITHSLIRPSRHGDLGDSGAERARKFSVLVSRIIDIAVETIAIKLIIVG